MKKSRRIALIDADTILYAISATSETCAKGQGDNGADLWMQTRDAEECYRLALSQIYDLVDEVQADGAFICVSDRENFRYKILPTYKANRRYTRRPPMLKTLRDLFQERRPYPFLFVKELEADDVCGISAGSLNRFGNEAIICSPDKDLRTIPGLLWHRGKMEEVTEEEADRNHLYQTLVGDTTDNYTGCPMIGPVKALALLSQWAGLSAADRWQKVLETFASRGFPAEYALTQARVARILRTDDWDPELKEVRLWEPPRRT